MSPRTPQGRFVWFAAIVGALLVALSIINIATLLMDINSKGPYAPLHDYPPQKVVEITANKVIIEGTRCSTASVVTVEMSVSWIRVQPPGAVYSQGTTIQTLKFPDGCKTDTYENIIPEAVRQLDEPGAKWRVVGSDMPISPRGRAGVTVAWQSNIFVLSPIATS